MDADMWGGFSEEENDLDELCTLLGEEETHLSRREESKRTCTSKRVKQHLQKGDPFLEEKQDSTAVNDTAAMKERMLAMERELAELKKCLAKKEESVTMVGEREGSSYSQKKRKAHSLPEQPFAKKRFPDRSVLLEKSLNGADLPQPPSRKLLDMSKMEPTTAASENSCKTDRFSGLRIKDPLVSSVTMQQRMEGRKMVRISQMSSRVKDGEIEGDWVTIGIVVNKLNPMDSAKGEKYSIWHLSDLSSQSAVVSLFLFGKVFQQHWKIPVGHVVALLNCTIMDKKEPSRTGSGGKYNLKIDHPAKLMHMGVSQDFTVCQASTRGGQPCHNFANKQFGGLCDYHIHSEYKKMRSTRMEFQSGYGPSVETLQQKLFKKSGDVYFYGGKTFAKAPAKPKKENKATILQKDGGKKEREGVTRYKNGVVVQEGSDLLRQMLQSQHVGSRYLTKHIKTEEAKRSGSTTTAKSASDLLSEHALKKNTSSGAKLNQTLGLLESQQSSKSPNGISNKKQAPALASESEFELFAPDVVLRPARADSKEEATNANLLDSRLSVPKVSCPVAIGDGKDQAVNECLMSNGARNGRGAEVVAKNNQSTTFKDINSRLGQVASTLGAAKTLPTAHLANQAPSLAKRKAIALVKGKGPILRRGSVPVASRQLSEAQKKLVMDRVDPFNQKGSELLERKKRLDLDSEDLEKVLNAKSSHDWEVKRDEWELEEAYFQRLERKEMLEERLQDLKELKVRVVQCKECNYVAEKESDMCRRENHVLTRLRAVKRCYQCHTCQYRCFTYNQRFPMQSCTCGERKYFQTSLYKERKGPKLDSEQLLLRGHEEKFLNSLK